MYLVDEGQVDCIHSTTDGTNFYTTVLNPGAVDNTNYYRFTCYVRIITKSKSNQDIYMFGLLRRSSMFSKL